MICVNNLSLYLRRLYRYWLLYIITVSAKSRIRPCSCLLVPIRSYSTDMKYSPRSTASVTGRHVASATDNEQRSPRDCKTMRKVNSRGQAGRRGPIWTRPPRVTSPHPQARAAAAAARFDQLCSLSEVDYRLQ